MRIGWQATDRLELSLIGREPVARPSRGVSGQQRHSPGTSARGGAEGDVPDGIIRQPVFRFVAGAAIVCAIAAPGRAQSAPEDHVKAALLLNFARFIEWPDEAFDGAQAPIDVCVLTPSPFGQALERALSGETVARRLRPRERCTVCRTSPVVICCLCWRQPNRAPARCSVKPGLTP